MPRDTAWAGAARNGATPAELNVLRWTEARADRRQAPGYLSRLQAPKKPEKPRPFVAFDLVCRGDDDPYTATPIGILVDRGIGASYTTLSDGPTTTGEAPRWLLALGERGAFAVCHNGARFAFHVILRRMAPDLARQGFTVFPYAGGTSIKGLAIKRGKVQWLLVDVGCMTGTEGMDYRSFLADYRQKYRQMLPDVSRLYGAVACFQSTALEYFGVGLRVTAGAIAIKALASALPATARWYSPNPLMTAMCRAGGAYRGGVAWGEPYHGPAWKVDLTKAYTWALSLGVPTRPTLGVCKEQGQEAPGVYLCRVKGRGKIPAYLCAWRGGESAFRKQNVQSLDSLAYVPQAEMFGLRALGYTVVPVFGFRYTDHLDLAPFTGKLMLLQSTFPRGTAQHSLAKALGNSVVGKLGQGSDRTDVCYSLSAPDSSWLPFVTPTQEVIDYLWVRQTHKPAAYHHVDSAATITARVRSRVYSFLSEWTDRGASVYHVDTDGAILGADPMGVVELANDRVGEWRLDGYDPNCTVLRAKAYTWQGRSVVAGVSDVAPETIELVLSGQLVSVGRNVLHMPWAPASPNETGSYTLSP